MKKLIAMTYIALCASTGFAEEKPSSGSFINQDTGAGRVFSTSQNSLDADSARFQPYGLNYVLFQGTEDDEASLEAHYSFRYTLFDCRRSNREGDQSCADDSRVQLAIFFSYTGEFDFYMETRDSSPVINRTSNPALHFYSMLNDKPLGIEYFDVGIEHRSNGQATEIDERNSDGLLKTQVAYDTNDHEYFDSISRGANYVSFTVGRDNPASDVKWQVSYKAYFSKSTDVNWGPLAEKDVDIEDYDLVRILLSDKVHSCSGCFLSELTLAGEYTFGHQLAETDSFELAMMAPLGRGRTKFPLMFSYHYGPMDTLSNYTKSVSSFGVGFAFSY